MRTRAGTARALVRGAVLALLGNAALVSGCSALPVSIGAASSARPDSMGRARAASPPSAQAVVSVVPLPRFVLRAAGRYAWPARVRIAADGGARDVAQALRTYLASEGVVASVVGGAAPAEISLRVVVGYDARLGDEGYALGITPQGVALRANTPHGLFYALQTLAQLSTRSARRLNTPATTIVDWPAYRWRGIQLDVARHFFSPTTVERFIDLAARYKLNVLHWHLSDDQAWRLREPRYPALGANGYTPQEVRAVVAYAARRYVTVVPEIDLPAHAGAVLRAYPSLACAQATLCTGGAGLVFAQDVLGDIVAEFPSRYVHVGGDEVPPAAARAQPAFTDRLERSLAARGRRLVGWDEILTPRLSPRAVVMAWRGPARVAQAVRQGNDVVVAGGALYFDAAQGDAAQEPPASPHMATLEQVYEYGLLPPGVSARQAAHVLGGQANLWSEHIAGERHLFYMALPRELALAELLWTPRGRKNWDGFVARLPDQLGWLRAHGYPFRIPNAAFELAGAPARFEAVAGHVQAVRAWTSAPYVRVSMRVPLTGAVIHYTRDGTAPTAASPRYQGPLSIALGPVAVVLQAAAFIDGRHGAISACSIARQSPGALRVHRGASRSWSALVSP